MGSFPTTLLIFHFLLIGLIASCSVKSLEDEHFQSENDTQFSENENPFPFLTFDEDGEAIVEPDMIEYDSPENQESCHHTYSLLDGQSMQFRSPSQPPSSSRDLTSATCFNSPPNTKISLKCEDFNINCDQDYYGLSFNENSQFAEKKFCGTDPAASEQTSDSSELKVIFQTGGRTSQGQASSESKFYCRVSVIGSGSGDNEFEPSQLSRVAPQSRNACNCGRRNAQSRIVGGTEAQANEFPWRCYLQVGRAFCGCSLISNKWVMTAAHCTQGSGRGSVVLGAHTRGRGSRVTTVTSTRIINHPRYNGRTVQNDISLIELSRPVTVSREISPVCLPWNQRTHTFAGTTGVSSGWGRTSGGSGSAATTLRKVDLPIVSNAECNRAYRGMVTSGMVCGNQAGRGTCQGDSGGSIDVLRNSRYYVVGITSWGDSRCRSYSVFTRVTGYLDWIQDNTRETFCRV